MVNYVDYAFVTIFINSLKEKLFILFAGFRCVKFTRAGGTVVVVDRLSLRIQYLQLLL